MEKDKNISIFPWLISQENHVPEDQYRVINGNGDILKFEYNNLDFYVDDQEGPFEGVKYQGEYSYIDETEAEVSLPVISFLYNKQTTDGTLETQERMIILTGVGFGTHPGHVGQKPSEYLIGVQVGTIDHKTGMLTTLRTASDMVEPKHFSIACIQGNPYGETELASLTTETVRELLAEGDKLRKGLIAQYNPSRATTAEDMQKRYDTPKVMVTRPFKDV